MMSKTIMQSSSNVEVHNPAGQGPVVILCEHASHHIPESYHDLGLQPAHRLSHAVWDPGAGEVAMQLSRALDAPLVASRISRLVYDCNRPPDAASAIPERSELIEVPGNRGLTREQRTARIETVYRPFCAAVGQILETRCRQHCPTALITVHSFTPSYHGQPRTVEIGILHDIDTRLSDAMLAQSRQLPHRQVKRNAPYGPEDGVTHSLKLHGIGNGIPNVMIEVRNDLLTTSDAVETMADELLRMIRPALSELGLLPLTSEEPRNA